MRRPGSAEIRCHSTAAHRRLLIAFAAVAVLAAAEIRAATPNAEPDLDQLAWMSGRWKGAFEGLPFESYYTGTEGGMMLGVSKQLNREGRVSLFELEQFLVREGQVILIPHPFGRASEDLFRLVDFDPAVQRAKFISPEHDFPTEIIYERTGDRLHIVVAGDQDGQKVEGIAQLDRVD